MVNIRAGAQSETILKYRIKNKTRNGCLLNVYNFCSWTFEDFNDFDEATKSYDLSYEDCSSVKGFNGKNENQITYCNIHPVMLPIT